MEKSSFIGLIGNKYRWMSIGSGPVWPIQQQVHTFVWMMRRKEIICSEHDLLASSPELLATWWEHNDMERTRFVRTHTHTYVLCCSIHQKFNYLCFRIKWLIARWWLHAERGPVYWRTRIDRVNFLVIAQPGVLHACFHCTATHVFDELWWRVGKIIIWKTKRNTAIITRLSIFVFRYEFEPKMVAL